jgi:hypothetical protein
MPDSESPLGISAVPAGPFSPAAKPARRNRWRLRMLLAINGLLAVLFVVTQLEPNQVAMLGPLGQYLHELFNPPAVPETSPLGKRLIADVTAVGGRADVMVRSRPYLGLVGNTEQFSISFTGRGFDDRALERLVNRYGKRIWELDLRDTMITDEGLRHLTGLSQLAQLAARGGLRIPAVYVPGNALSPLRGSKERPRQFRGTPADSRPLVLGQARAISAESRDGGFRPGVRL